MRVIIDQVGPYTLRPARDRFSTLVRSIISQQISISARRSIRMRLEQAIAPARISSESLLALDNARLRSVGLSPQKAAYVHDLALKTSDGTVNLRTIGRSSDEEIIEILTQVKGIGRWTAQMFLIFASRPAGCFSRRRFGHSDGDSRSLLFGGPAGSCHVHWGGRLLATVFFGGKLVLLAQFGSCTKRKSKRKRLSNVIRICRHSPKT